MSNFPMWWSDDITVFNKYTDKQTNLVTWYKTVLNNCFWKNTGSKLVINDTVVDTNDIITRIPKSDKFKENYQWISVPNDLMSNYFTLQTGDIIVKGIVDDIIDEYTTGHRSTDLIKKYKRLQGCFEVQQVAINVGPGRASEHYLARGI